MTAFLKNKRQLAYYIAIGALAATTHFSVVALLDMHPLLSNIIAFFIAFGLSFLGHRLLTFASLQDEKKLRLGPFFLVAFSALVLNESLYFLLLHYTSLYYLVSLVLVLSTVSVYTFILSRFWACR